MAGLTPAQEKVFRFVQEFITGHGYSPSYEEVRRHLGFKSLNSVYKHLKQLEERGYLRTPWNNKKRAIDLVAVRSGAASIPFLGTVAAGIPIEPVQTAEAIEVPENFLGNGSNFALRVSGESMIEDGIRDGDILIIAQQPWAENGQTVVAMVQGEATVKKFYRRENEIELKPANARMKSIMARAEDVEVVGVVMGLLRNYRRKAGSGEQ
jgi:repressor LexA